MTQTVGPEKPFQIKVSDEQLLTLHKKLSLATFPDELDDAGQLYGAPLSDIRRLATRWQDGYDWRKHEAALNSELPQFKRNIDVDGFGALDIHYVHKRSKAEDAIPLLFIHGWPGSFIEVRKILPLLIESSPDHPAFHVVAISLPGYGFSEAPKKKGFALPQYAEVGNKLMIALGYSEYVTQGGDWGHFITREIAKLYGGTHSKAWHSNLPMAAAPKIYLNPSFYLRAIFFGLSAEDKEKLDQTQSFSKQGSGYSTQQATKPQTLGYALADSPVGLLAWIFEKLVSWTDDYPWDDDEVLTWVSIYWFSQAGPAASLRIYYEFAKAMGGDLSTMTQRTAIPVGYSFFPKEVFRFPKSWLKAPNLVFESEHDRGGHFAAHERPHELVGDLRKMFGKGGPAFGVVTTKL